ncbi:MAG: hypothetical protein K2N34_05635 [Lachnospiraceae bacterium]|nr:hypothetical protein [Lachnospiraceae bacterium]
MIDTKEFIPLESRWQDINMHLKSKGYEVFPPGVKIGDCIEPYIIVKNDGGYKHVNFSTNRDMYTVMCYVPKGQYSKLEPMVQKVKQDMKELEPMIVQYGQELPSYYDDTYKAHYIGIEYENYKKI